MRKRQLGFNPISIKSANFSTVLSISLVLFLLGFMLLFIFHALEASKTLRENVSFTVYLNSGTSVEDALLLEKTLSENKNVKNTSYISSEEASKMMDEIMGENHLDVLNNVNPYSASILVNLKAESLNSENINKFIKSVEQKDIVDSVDYRQDLVKDINNVIYNVSIFVLAFIICLLIIAITLINHTISLTIYAKRFLIRSMHLVGAKRGFILRPFLLKGILLGCLGGFIADILLAGIIFWIDSSFKGVIVFEQYYQIYILCGVFIFLFGIVLSFISTLISMYRYMNLSNDQLYK
ncbi:MAG: permease-like cell division protein FtsX [Bacteroidales bacterium]|jgi:cell division transport system permease protein|nr:permease-like cell division protein FtsX [Bacteroidales bacterium]